METWVGNSSFLKLQKKKKINFTEIKCYSFLNKIEFYPQGSMLQISHSYDKIKLSFVIFLQKISPCYSTEQETRRRQKKKFLMNF